ncbi:hypothetical protein [Helicobacter enhydrae]|nr:hypothetical protein [Helicobacter enhydrae]
MQRNSTAQKAIRYSFLLLGFCFYTYLTDIYVWLPPLLGILFLGFSHSLQKSDLWALLSICFCVLFWGLDKDLPLGVPLVFFLAGYYLLFLQCSFFLQKGIYFEWILIVLFYLFCFGVLSLLGLVNLDFALKLSVLSILLEGLWRFYASKI